MDGHRTEATPGPDGASELEAPSELFQLNQCSYAAQLCECHGPSAEKDSRVIAFH